MTPERIDSVNEALLADHHAFWSTGREHAFVEDLGGQRAKMIAGDMYETGVILVSTDIDGACTVGAGEAIPQA